MDEGRMTDEVVRVKVSELGPQPAKIEFVSEERSMQLMRRVLHERPAEGENRLDVSLHTMAAEARRVTGEILGQLARLKEGKISDQEAKEAMADVVRGTVLYQEWEKVNKRVFTQEELDFIAGARLRFEPDHRSEVGSSAAHETMLQFDTASIRAQREVVTGDQLRLTDMQKTNEMAHLESVATVMRYEWRAGRADPFTMMATLWHDGAKWMPPGNPDGRGEIRLWMHEMMSAVRAKGVSKEFFKETGYTDKQAELLSDWIEFQVAHHGFGEFPANLASAIGKPVIDGGMVMHRIRPLRGGVAVMEKTGEPYFTVRNTDALSKMGGYLAGQVEMVRAADNLDGAFDTSYPKYVFTTPENVYNDCQNAGELLVGSFGRTLSLNLLDGGVVNQRGMLSEQSENLFRSELFIGAMSLDPDDPVTSALFSVLDFGYGEKTVGQRMLEISKRVHAGFKAWKETGYEGGKEGFSKVLRDAVSEFGEIYRSNLFVGLDKKFKAADFLQLAIARQAFVTGASGVDGREYSRFDAKHLEKTFMGNVLPAYLQHQGDGLLGEGKRDEILVYSKMRGIGGIGWEKKDDAIGS